MARYFFDIIDNDVIYRDEFGIELSDFEEARQQAQSLLPDIARQELPNGEAHRFVCEVRGEDGRRLYRGSLIYRGENLC